MSDEARSIELEIEVPGDPEEVWRAIATGPGICTLGHLAYRDRLSAAGIPAGAGWPVP